VLPVVPASSSFSVDTSDSTSSVDGEQTQQETVQETQQERVPLTTTVVTKRTKSIAHDDWVCHQAMIFHVDLEHGGDACAGVLQLSVVAYDPTDIKVVGGFDEYIKPPANAVWSSHVSDVHGIDPKDVRITSAFEIKDVWEQFISFIEGLLDDGTKRGVIAAWGGQYLRIFYWLFNGVLHAMYSVIKVVASDKSHPWHKYLSKHIGTL
jgi:hypothetical protein